MLPPRSAVRSNQLTDQRTTKSCHRGLQPIPCSTKSAARSAQTAHMIGRGSTQLRALPWLYSWNTTRGPRWHSSYMPCHDYTHDTRLRVRGPRCHFVECLKPTADRGPLVSSQGPSELQGILESLRTFFVSDWYAYSHVKFWSHLALSLNYEEVDESGLISAALHILLQSWLKQDSNDDPWESIDRFSTIEHAGSSCQPKKRRSVRERIPITAIHRSLHSHSFPLDGKSHQEITVWILCFSHNTHQPDTCATGVCENCRVPCIFPTAHTLALKALPIVLVCCALQDWKPLNLKRAGAVAKPRSKRRDCNISQGHSAECMHGWLNIGSSPI